jgi:hypothetical protein
LTTYIFNGSVSTLSPRYFSVAARNSVLLAYALLRGEWPVICPVDVVEDVGKEVAARREGGKYVLDLGLCGVGCLYLRMDLSNRGRVFEQEARLE